MTPWRLALLALLCLMPFGAVSLAEQAEAGEESSESVPLIPREPSGEPIQLDTVRLWIFGHVRPIAVFETVDYGNLGPEPRERFTAVGARTKLKLDGRLEDRARFYASYIIDFTEVDQGTDTASTESENGRIKMIDSYVDLYGTGTYWRLGSQTQYWGYINGFWKPTNRFNATDSSYKSRELEDQKLPETGVEWVWLFARQELHLIYVPVSKVNKLNPNQIGFLSFLGYEAERPPARSDNSKYVARLTGALGGLDYQLSYIDGLNPRADFQNNGYVVETVDETTGDPIESDRRVESAVDGHTVYHRYRTPALDIQYTTGPAKWKAAAVYYDTGDTAGSEDPLRQNDWYEWLAGIELGAWGNILDLHYGQVVVPNLKFESEFFPEDPERKRVYFQNGLLGQFRDRTHVVSAKYRRNFIGERLEFSQDFEWNWDESWEEQTRFFSRTDVAWFFNDAKTVAARVRPGYFMNREIVTKEIMAEVQLDF